jgi:DNA-binding response OmpR family regulator
MQLSLDFFGLSHFRKSKACANCKYWHYNRVICPNGFAFTANAVTDALNAAATNTFDLVISDLGLPDGTGNQLMKKLRTPMVCAASR